MVKPIKKQRESKSLFNNKIKHLCQSYNTILLVHSNSLNTSSIHTFRETIRDTSKVLFGKYKHLCKSLECYNQNLKSLTSKFTNNCFLIFTKDENLKNKIETMVIEDYIKAGDFLTESVVMKKGILNINRNNLDSYLRSLNVMCSSKEGKVFLEEDYIIKEGKVSNNDAKILKMLGMKNVKMGMKVIDVYENKLEIKK